MPKTISRLITFTFLLGIGVWGWLQVGQAQKFWPSNFSTYASVLTNAAGKTQALRILALEANQIVINLPALESAPRLLECQNICAWENRKIEFSRESGKIIATLNDGPNLWSGELLEQNVIQAEISEPVAQSLIAKKSALDSSHSEVASITEEIQQLEKIINDPDSLQNITSTESQVWEQKIQNLSQVLKKLKNENSILNEKLKENTKINLEYQIAQAAKDQLVVKEVVPIPVLESIAPEFEEAQG